MNYLRMNRLIQWHPICVFVDMGVYMYVCMYVCMCIYELNVCGVSMHAVTHTRAHAHMYVTIQSLYTSILPCTHTNYAATLLLHTYLPTNIIDAKDIPNCIKLIPLLGQHIDHRALIDGTNA